MTAQTSIRAHKTSTTGQTGPRPRWLTYPEAAELCTLSVRSLKRLTAAGTLRCYVVGGKVLRLKASDVEALICRRTSTATGNGVAPPRRGRSEAARRQHSLFLYRGCQAITSNQCSAGILGQGPWRALEEGARGPVHATPLRGPQVGGRPSGHESVEARQGRPPWSRCWLRTSR
jgi:excisionase family DNA binding protein